MVSRRDIVLWGLALAVMPVLGGPAQAGDFDPQPDAGFDRWKARFRNRAVAKGLPVSVVDASLGAARFLPGVIAKDRSQLEFSLAFEDYLAIAVSDERVTAGRAAFAVRRGLLGQIGQSYGVPAQILASIWGVESFYGTKRGEVPVMSALSTLVYEGRRADFFEGQLLAAMKIVSMGVRPQHMTGGWAGAMGHTQFIPTTYLGFRQDFRGDGVADVASKQPRNGAEHPRRAARPETDGRVPVERMLCRPRGACMMVESPGERSRVQRQISREDRLGGEPRGCERLVDPVAR